MAIRPELTSLRPSSCAFMNKVLASPNIGLKSARKDFLESADLSNKTNKVRILTLTLLHYKPSP